MKLLRGYTSTLARCLIALAPLAVSACDEPVPPTDSVPGAFGPMGLARRVDVPTSGVELGLGWVTGRSQVVPSRCIEFAPVKETGQVSTLNMREVSDQSEIMDSLGVSAAVSVKSMAASGSARASFARSSKVKSNSTNLMLEAKLENGVMFVGPANRAAQVRKAFPDLDAPTPQVEDPALGDERAGDTVRLKPWALRVLRSRGAGQFRRQCGDSFVSAIYSGAELLATLHFRAQDSATRESVKAAVRAKYGPVKVSAEAQAKNEENLSKSELTITYLQVGGGGEDSILPISHDDLVDKLKGLPEEAFRNPRFHAMEVTPYAALPDWPAGEVLSARVEEVNEAVADYYWFLTTLEDDIEEILASPEGYDFRTGLSEEELKALEDQIIGLRRNLLVAMEVKARGSIPEVALEPAVYEFLYNPTYRLDFEALKRSLEALDASERSSTAEWFDQLAEALSQAVPFGNPNVLRILLPVPCVDDAVATRAGAVDWYVRPQAMRMCELDPLDNECLTRKQLTELESLVPDGRGPGCPGSG